jgi:hypothetical protein
MTFRNAALPAALLAVFLIASVAGLPEALGAHPWWAVRAGVIGSLIGAVIFAATVGLGVRRAMILPFAGLGILAASAAVVLGKGAFAASLAENALAGRFWFFGWFAICACLYLLLASLIHRR